MKKAMTEARKRANQKWDAENLKRLSLAMNKSDYESMRTHIEERNESQNRFINRAIQETIVNDRRNNTDNEQKGGD